MVLDSFGMFWAQSVPGKPIVFRHPQFVQTRRKEDLFDLRERLEELTQVPYSDGDMETQIDQRVGHLEIFLGNTLHNILEVVFPNFFLKRHLKLGVFHPEKPVNLGLAVTTMGDHCLVNLAEGDHGQSTHWLHG